MRVRFKSHLEQLQRARTSTGRDMLEGWCLDRNERVTEFPDDILAGLYRQLPKFILNTYPDTDYFYEKGGFMKDLLKKFKSGATRNEDAEAERFDLISPFAMQRLAIIYAEGAFSGSLQTLIDGTDYLRAGTGISIAKHL